MALQLKHFTDRVEVVDGEFVLGWVELDLAGVGAGAGLDRDWLPLEGTNSGHLQVSKPSIRHTNFLCSRAFYGMKIYFRDIPNAKSHTNAPKQDFTHKNCALTMQLQVSARFCAASQAGLLSPQQPRSRAGSFVQQLGSFISAAVAEVAEQRRSRAGSFVARRDREEGGQVSVIAVRQLLNS